MSDQICNMSGQNRYLQGPSTQEKLFPAHCNRIYLFYSGATPIGDTPRGLQVQLRKLDNNETSIIYTYSTAVAKTIQ